MAEAPAHGVLEFSWWIAAGLNLLPTPLGLADWLDRLNGLLTVSSLVAGLLLAAGLAWCLARSAGRADGWRADALLLVWTVLPPALMAWQSSTVYLHYLVVLFPTIFLLMALPLVESVGNVAIEVVGELISKPYIEITLNLMARFGVQVARDGWASFTVPTGVAYKAPGEIFVEGDASSASYFLAVQSTESLIGDSVERMRRSIRLFRWPD